MSQQVLEHPAFTAVRTVHAGLDSLTETGSWSLSNADVGEVLAEIATAEARLGAARLALVAEADRRNLGVCEATDTAGWLRARLLVGPGEARRSVTLAGVLSSQCAATGSALCRGVLSVEHARVIAHAVTQLPPVEPEVTVRAEEFLICHAAALDPVLLRRAAEALVETLITRPDRDEQLLRDVTRREFTAVTAADGMVRLHGWLDREAWAGIAAVLDPLAAPVPAGDDGTSDPRSPAWRRADALIAMAQTAAGADGGGAGERALTVTIDYDALTGRLSGMGLLNTGECISPAAARRIGCDAMVVPIVLGGTGQPLDIGRAARTVPTPIRRALVCRDQGCAFPGCDRPADWSEAHHIVHWADGGPTALHNLALLCGQHHHSVHHHGWTVHLHTDGLPTFTPPAVIDPERRPRRHHRYALRLLDYNLTGK
ncbi:MAG: DUF222 domain-containing protein [Mycobacteriales bacterium]